MNRYRVLRSDGAHEAVDGRSSRLADLSRYTEKKKLKYTIIRKTNIENTYGASTYV